jgi:hypothetical protein
MFGSKRATAILNGDSPACAWTRSFRTNAAAPTSLPSSRAASRSPVWTLRLPGTADPPFERLPSAAWSQILEIRSGPRLVRKVAAADALNAEVLHSFRAWRRPPAWVREWEARSGPAPPAMVLVTSPTMTWPTDSLGIGCSPHVSASPTGRPGSAPALSGLGAPGLMAR